MWLRFVVAADCSLCVANWSLRNKWRSEHLALNQTGTGNRTSTQGIRQLALYEGCKMNDTDEVNTRNTAAPKRPAKVTTHSSGKTRASSDHVQTALKAFMNNDTIGALGERTHRMCHVRQTFLHSCNKKRFGPNLLPYTAGRILYGWRQYSLLSLDCSYTFVTGSSHWFSLHILRIR
jgi:hypothetical protein